MEIYAYYLSEWQIISPKNVERVMKMRFVKMSAFTILLILCSITMGNVYAEKHSIPEREKNIELSDEQKQELETLHMEILNLRKDLIKKYMEYGVYTKEQGEKIISHLEHHYEKLKQNNYILKWHGKYKHDEKREN